METVISIPGAYRTFEAIRNLGYNLNSSIADLVDNSITEKVDAHNVIINLSLNQNFEVVFRMTDDGIGMSSAELEEAMRVGAEAEYTAGDLGKFGFGMKSASLAHSNILTVISKKKNFEITAYSWNMAFVKDTKAWSLLKLNTEEINSRLKNENLSISGNGTIVLWDDLFLLNSEYNSIKSNKLADNFLFRKIEELKLHLRMVFHRFLNSNSGIGRHIEIFVNNEKLIGWDPFCKLELNTFKFLFKSDLSQLYLKNYKKPIELNAFILPNKDGFSSEKAWKEAKGLLTWNDSQGYYIYRANRLIRFGGWHGTKAKDEHDKLARVSIDIDPELDSEFRITVNKNRVEFPEQLFQHLKNVINPVVIKKAQGQYRREPEKSTIKNKIRDNKKIQSVSKNLLKENKISTQSNPDSSSSEIVVTNPSGTWLSNKLNEFLKYGNNDNYEIISDHIENGQLWKIVCDPNDKFKVIVNSSHPFYSHIYNNGAEKQVTEAIDALLFSLAFSELFNKTHQNAYLFDTFKSVFSKALEKLIKEKII